MEENELKCYLQKRVKIYRQHGSFVAEKVSTIWETENREEVCGHYCSLILSSFSNSLFLSFSFYLFPIFFLSFPSISYTPLFFSLYVALFSILFLLYSSSLCAISFFVFLTSYIPIYFSNKTNKWQRVYYYSVFYSWFFSKTEKAHFFVWVSVSVYTFQSFGSRFFLRKFLCSSWIWKEICV